MVSPSRHGAENSKWVIERARYYRRTVMDRGQDGRRWGLVLTYPDMIGDLALSTLGVVVGSVSGIAFFGHGTRHRFRDGFRTIP